MGDYKRIKIEPSEELEASSPSHSNTELHGNTAVGHRLHRKCPYLDTIQRSVLDFDMLPICSVSLSPLNVYACLVCGRFLQGRGKGSHAYTHSVMTSHYVFMRLSDGKCFCLPDNYEVIDSSLEDIKYFLNPTFNQSDISALDREAALSRDIHGTSYLPGFVGVNSLRCSDYVTVAVQALAHVRSIRNFFLNTENYIDINNNLVQVFGMAVRKIWSRGNFKSSVTPNALVQEIAIASQDKFSPHSRQDSFEFIVWFVNYLHQALSSKTSISGIKPKRANQAKSIITETFQGSIEVCTLRKSKTSETSQKMDESDNAANGDSHIWSESTSVSPFNCLSLELPDCPLFRDSEGSLVIPQIPILQVLNKFDGVNFQDVVGTSEGYLRKRYRLRELPECLVLNLKRFRFNNFTLEKNPTIVTFPVKSLEMKDYLFGFKEEIPKDSDLNDMSHEELVKCLEKFETFYFANEKDRTKDTSNVPQEDLKQRLRQVLSRWKLRVDNTITKYDLVANIIHDSHMLTQTVAIGGATSESVPAAASQLGTALGLGNLGAASSNNATPTSVSSVLTAGHFKVQLGTPTGTWFELQDLHVAETLPQLVGLSEATVLIYQRRAVGNTNNNGNSNNNDTSTKQQSVSKAESKKRSIEDL